MTTDPKDPKNAFQRVDLEVKIERCANVLRAAQELERITTPGRAGGPMVMLATTELSRLLEEWSTYV